MKNYEIMFIVRPTLAEEDVKQVVKKFEEMGQRELAYEIKDFKSGYYFVFEVESTDDKAIKEFDRLALISSDIIRHLITTIED